MYNMGEVVKFNNKVPNESLWGTLAVITKINPSSTYCYSVRFRRSYEILEHSHGDAKEIWIDKV